MQEFTNPTLDTNSLPRYEEVELNAIDPKYWNVVLINIAIVLLFIGAGLTTILILKETLMEYLYVILTAYVVFAILLLVLYRVDIQRRGFALRERDIMYKNGIIALSTTIIPFSRIQHIALDEGLFSRMFGLGALRIFTAGGASGSLHIPGISIDRAKSIKELLMQQINKAD